MHSQFIRHPANHLPGYSGVHVVFFLTPEKSSTYFLSSKHRHAWTKLAVTSEQSTSTCWLHFTALTPAKPSKHGKTSRKYRPIGNRAQPATAGSNTLIHSQLSQKLHPALLHIAFFSACILYTAVYETNTINTHLSWNAMNVNIVNSLNAGMQWWCGLETVRRQCGEYKRFVSRYITACVCIYQKTQAEQHGLNNGQLHDGSIRVASLGSWSWRNSISPSRLSLVTYRLLDCRPPSAYILVDL